MFACVVTAFGTLKYPVLLLIRINAEAGISEKKISDTNEILGAVIVRKIQENRREKSTNSSKSSSLLQHSNCRSLWAANVLSDASCHNFRKT